jgi:ABC-2 type transport system ATP-binding protein
MIEIKNIRKKYKQREVLKGVSLNISSGVIVGLVGPNGAGKSTLMQIIANILKPTSGDVYFHGQSVKDIKRGFYEKIGYVPQDLALYHTLSVADNIAFWSNLSATKNTDDKIKEIITTVGLDDLLAVKVDQLSGGMKRKLNIAVALMHNPELIIMDEPTVGIDIQSKLEIITFIQKLKNEGKTIIYSSHDAYEVEKLCDEIVILNDGQVKYHGLQKELVNAAKEKGHLMDDDSFTAVLSKLGQW